MTEYIPSETMIPEKRLESLIDQAIELQKMKCLYHNASDGHVSLYSDHICDR